MNDKTFFYISGDKEKGLVGEYLYEGKKEPKAILSENGGGYFQRHMVAPDEFEWWGLETNYKGEVQKLTGATGAYSMILAVKYKKGNYDRMSVTVSPNDRKTYLLGERILTW